MASKINSITISEPYAFTGGKSWDFCVEFKNVIDYKRSSPHIITLQQKVLEYDTKLAALDGAQPNKIESITRGGSPLSITNKTVEIGEAGHTILNSSGTSLLSRPNIQFKNLKVEDNSTLSCTTVTGLTATAIKLDDQAFFGALVFNF